MTKQSGHIGSSTRFIVSGGSLVHAAFACLCLPLLLAASPRDGCTVCTTVTLRNNTFVQPRNWMTTLCRISTIADVTNSTEYGPTEADSY